MKRLSAAISVVGIVLLILSSCQKERKGTAGKEYQNFFAYSVMDEYYLWKDEIASSLNLWKESNNSKVDPIEKVKSIRYKVNGKDYDKWTKLTDDYESFEGSVSGSYFTYGMDFILYYLDNTRKQLVAVVTVVYKGSPAEKAGLKRGDVITMFAGKILTPSNYSLVLAHDYRLAGTCKLTLEDSREVRISAVQMYENPILCHRTFDVNGFKAGYLAYNSFTEKSITDLIPIFKEFKKEGVSKMILDLRYNGGGYVNAEDAIASMLAPIEAVENRELFQIQRYNKDIEKMYKEHLGPDCLKSFFQTEYSYKDPESGATVSSSTKGANIDITDLYVIMTGQSASASESLVVGLKPYLNVHIIGEQTVGKFCGGYIISSEEWAQYIKDKTVADEFRVATKNWGIYVMTSTYYDKNGNNPVIPDGLIPDIEAEDNPLSGHQLGDENEPLIRIALEKMGKSYLNPRTSSVDASKHSPSIFQDQIRKNNFGIMVFDTPLR